MSLWMQVSPQALPTLQILQHPVAVVGVLVAFGAGVGVLVAGTGVFVAVGATTCVDVDVGVLLVVSPEVPVPKAIRHSTSSTTTPPMIHHFHFLSTVLPPGPYRPSIRQNVA